MEEVDSLPTRERAVIMARFFDSAKLKDIASNYGISKQRVEQIQKKALSRLKIKVVKRLGGDMVD
jgi:RNA polymerase sigma factor (sigma-70 family)